MKRGVAWPNPRFTDNGDGTVTDNMTGLIWFENAGCAELTDWSTAVWACSKLGTGDCGLNDGSNAGDWRLPNVRELQSLVDYGNSVPALPAGHPFINVNSHYYWTGTTTPGDTNLVRVLFPATDTHGRHSQERREIQKAGYTNSIGSRCSDGGQDVSGA